MPPPPASAGRADLPGVLRLGPRRPDRARPAGHRRGGAGDHARAGHPHRGLRPHRHAPARAALQPGPLGAPGADRRQPNWSGSACRGPPSRPRASARAVRWSPTGRRRARAAEPPGRDHLALDRQPLARRQKRAPIGALFACGRVVRSGGDAQPASAPDAPAPAPHSSTRSAAAATQLAGGILASARRCCAAPSPRRRWPGCGRRTATPCRSPVCDCVLASWVM